MTGLRSAQPDDHAPRLRILLIRDLDTHSDANLSAIRAGLADAGYQLVTIVDADLALPEKIAATQPDMLIIESEAAARDKLAERKTVERAKGLLMQQLQISEDDAYRRLRRLAMEKSIRLIEAARRVIDIGSALG